jgi:acetyl-CoA carboxylase carboxyl transferase subunit beta
MKEFFRRTPKKFTAAERDKNASVPDNMWVKCPKCSELIYTKQLADNLQVCPKCQHHMRLSSWEWAGLLDPGSFREEDADLVPSDPLGFVSPKETYADKLAQSQQRTGLRDAVIAGRGAVNGLPLCVGICDFGFMGGSMGSVFGEKMARAAERAAHLGVPLLTINTSGGARMHEGILSLMQMAKVSVALTKLARARQPHISLLTDPCFGGVTASYASVADIIIAEPGAKIGFAGTRVIEQTIHQKLPADFQTAEFLLQHGMIDMVVPRAELRATLTRLLQLYRRPPTMVYVTPQHERQAVPTDA